ncbi:hypothetical protein HN388_00845, partial [bacterium]|nr:hypothetical protein [bacterium]
LWSETITLVGANSIHTPDPISLLAVRADRLLLVDGEEIIEGISATVSIPELEFYSFTPINVVAAGTDNRFDLFDLDEKLNDLPLTARKMNDVMPPTGFARFLGSESLEDIISTVSFTNGAANFYMANDAVEVLRFFVGPEVPAERDPVPTGRFMIGFNDPRPESVLITTSNDTIQANGYSTITIGAQLYDSAGNETEIDNIPVSFLLSEGSSGTCQFAPVTVMTNADGYAETELSGILSGELYVSCSVTAYNRILEVFTVDEELSLNIVVIPGVAEQWDISSSAAIAGSDSELGVSAQLIDFFGNSVSQQGTEMNFTVDPPEMGNFQPMNAVSDATGYCETVFVPTGYAGLVNLGGISDYPVDSIALMLRDVLVLSDPAFNEEPEAHNTFEATDLTMVLLDNNPDGLFVDIPFSSNFDGLIFHLAIETGFNAEGATSDPFNMPVSYGHSDKPDFVLTSKHNWDGNYSDFRKWTSEWEWWDTASEAYIPTSGEWVESVMVQDRWVTRSDSGIAMRIPWGPFGGQPDSLKVELYITQEDGGDLRSALDSVPSDATLNIDFEPDSTDPADWATLTLPVTLSNWSEVYQVRTDFPTPPLITELSVTPDVLSAGMSFIVSAEVEDQGDGIGDVVVDLSGMAGPAIVRLAEVDGNYMLGSAVPLGSPGGTIEIIVNAYDESNRLASSSTVEVEVTAQVDVIVHVDDIIGDDHGPNQPGIEHKYYTYPTNSVFVPSAFDITALDIYRTTAAVSGQPINMVAFQVSIGDLPDPADSHTADWNPPYGELNIQKIDILIDTGAGGATSSLPNRRASFQAWNAWDFAIIMDGWYKALVPSYGNNTVEAWRENAMRSDSEIMIFGDVNSDYITALVAEDALGNPTDEDLASWSMAVLISSHDFGGEEVLGGIRWVNESSSEWNFGGGHFTDRDPNIIDLLLVPGEGKTVGRSQDYLLDYGTEEAVQRLNDGLTPCSIEMSAFEDTGPPSINIVRNNGEVISVDPLLNAPIAFTLEITDDYQVSGATFSYRSMSSGSQWDDTTDMGYVGNNLWSVDIPADWIDENLVYSPIDSTRYFEFQVTAVDAVEKESVSPVTTMQLSQSQSSLWFDANMGVEELSMRHIDGSGLKLDYRLLDEIVALYADEFGVTFSADSLATLMTLGWEISSVEPAISNAKALHDGVALNCFRTIKLDAGTAESSIDLDNVFTTPFSLTMHYQEDQLTSSMKENSVGIFEYKPQANRWSLIGGHVNEQSNEVTAHLAKAGTFGLFYSDKLAVDESEVVSGIILEPNPFSPNGDGLYDETNISFYLTREASVTVEIYNIDGRLCQRLEDTFTFADEDQINGAAHRVEGIIWNGTDDKGDNVPYGVYIMRLLVTYNQGGGRRTIGSNHPVAVIR